MAEISASHPAVVTAGAGDGVWHRDHQRLLGILWDPGRVDELMLLLLGRPLPLLLWHLLIHRGVHQGGRGRRRRLRSHVHWRELGEKLR